MMLGLLTAGLAVSTVGLAIELMNYRGLVKSLRNTVNDLEGSSEYWHGMAEKFSTDLDKRTKDLDVQLNETRTLINLRNEAQSESDSNAQKYLNEKARNEALLNKCQELSNLLDSEKERADTNNDLLEQRVDEVEKLKKLYRDFTEVKYKIPDSYEIQEIRGNCIVFGKYVDYPNHEVPIKAFADEDEDYNLGLAEELKEKLEEKI
jgi:septal ring factor EnvC (AmiA/AmiB activator)